MAEMLGFATIAIPLLRTGAAQFVHESTPQAAAASLVSGVKAFLSTNPGQVQKVLLVVYGNPHMKSYLRGLARNL
jgi:O-acetyl-ADP-ribose deacetylase (regulator of RNase III)